MQKTGLSFKDLRDEKKRIQNKNIFGYILVIYNISICIDINLWKSVADNLLKYEEIKRWCLLKLTHCTAFVNIVIINSCELLNKYQ